MEILKIYQLKNAYIIYQMIPKKEITSPENHMTCLCKPSNISKKGNFENLSSKKCLYNHQKIPYLVILY